MKRLKLNRWLISFVALMMLLLVFLPSDTPQIEPELTNIPDSDYFMRNVTVYQYNPDGSIANTLRATRMQHYIEQNLSILQSPNITYNKSDSGNWQLRSPQGELINNTILTLKDQVTIEEFSQTNQSQAKIETRNLTIDLQKNIAASNESVLVVSPLFKTESVGFEFDLSNEIIKLKADVRTEIYQQ